MGTEFHTKLLKIVTDLAKLLADIPKNPGVQATGMVQGAREIAQSAPQQALNKLFPQPQAGGQPPA